jgi:hypothetical protein
LYSAKSHQTAWTCNATQQHNPFQSVKAQASYAKLWSGQSIVCWSVQLLHLSPQVSTNQALDNQGIYNTEIMGAVANDLSIPCYKSMRSLCNDAGGHDRKCALIDELQACTFSTLLATRASKGGAYRRRILKMSALRVRPRRAAKHLSNSGN